MSLYLLPLARARGLGIHVEARGTVSATFDADQIEQVLTNLIVNAIHATSRDGHVVVHVDFAQVDTDDGEHPPAAI